jgi:hypothetical protein
LYGFLLSQEEAVRLSAEGGKKGRTPSFFTAEVTILGAGESSLRLPAIVDLGAQASVRGGGTF